MREICDFSKLFALGTGKEFLLVGALEAGSALLCLDPDASIDASMPRIRAALRTLRMAVSVSEISVAILAASLKTWAASDWSLMPRILVILVMRFVSSDWE